MFSRQLSIEGHWNLEIEVEGFIYYTFGRSVMLVTKAKSLLESS